MKKLLIIGLGLTCTIANANYVKISKNPANDWEAESYRTTKPVQSIYHLHYSNNWDEDPEGISEAPDKNKYGLYSYSNIELKQMPSKSFPLTRPQVHQDLAKILKFDESLVANKFKAVSKKTDYFCRVEGQMMAMFDVHYDGGDNFRFPHLVHANVKSATMVGKPKITCEKYD